MQNGDETLSSMLSCGPALLVTMHITLEQGSGWGSGIHYSLKIKPIIHLIKILGYLLK